MSGPAPLPLDQYAAVVARILHDAGVPLDVVLAELGLSPVMWHASAAAWERALDEALSRGDDQLLALFASHFIATRAALGRAAAARAARAEPLNGPETVAPSHDRVSLPALPFRTSETPPPVDEATRRALARVGLPFVQPSPAAGDGGMIADAPGSPPTLRSPRLAAVPGPPSSMPVEAGPATVRLEDACSPASDAPPSSTSSHVPAAPHAALEDERAREDERDVPAPIPLVRVKRRSPRASWWVRIRGWLRGGRA